MSDSLKEAVSLAKAMHRDFYSDASKLKLFDYTAGVISQIDNMYAGIRKRYTEAVALNREIEAENERLRDTIKTLREFIKPPMAGK
jgi:hypothetical protein